MAYINQENKRVIAAALKAALRDYPTLKYSLSIRDNSVITCKITQGPKCLDLENGRDVNNVNVYYIEKFFKPDAAVILTKIKYCLNTNNYDRSDSQSDYFDVGHYINIEIGQYDKPFVGV